MSLSLSLAKVLGGAFLVVGTLILFALVGINPFGVHPPLPVWADVVVGFAFLAVGWVMVRGGAITL